MRRCKDLVVTDSTSKCFAFFVAAMATLLLTAQPIWAQTETDQKIQAHLNAGEFPRAIELAKGLETIDADQWISRIAMRQVQSGAQSGGYQSAGMITSDDIRSDTLGGMYGGENQNPNRPGNAGGVTEADFEPLMELIRTTIAPDDWDDTNGDGTIQAYPAGVFVDASGTLRRVKVDSKNQLRTLRDGALADSGNRVTRWSSDLRKVSITRLERRAQLRAAQGLPIEEEMQNLGGLYEIKYLMVYPDTGDIVVAGPAGPWKNDDTGRPLNVKTGQPVLQLDDLVVCLRNAWEKNGKFGCAITPRQKNLAETQEFLANSTLKGAAWRDELRAVLGQQDVEVFGIDPATHTGRILVEADYRMKLVGMGIEPSIPEVPSYLERVKLKKDGTIDGMTVARWWFTLNYDSVTTDQQHETFTFAGSGVKVLSENDMVSQIGERIHTGTSEGPTKEFARDFTKHFPEMAGAYPIYAQLKNVFDLALVSSLIRNEGIADRVDWDLTFFGSPESDSELHYHVRKDEVAHQVDSVMNHKTLRQRVGGKTLKHTIVGVSGGISCNLREVTKKDAIAVSNESELGKTSDEAKPQVPVERWWWD